ncbi:6-phospho-beta-glucosidase [Clostridium acetobutylicum]|uniref:Beta-glucosidase n=1 Tax=Clostridium acetobutylicum (strain ATCC 824 / DSM 792 / JCM 1419 / IAM 19013 / LMG 5710 / NBRC 13948 / NRRL B-527 / VKM B-1787 / 2291 / W) TaxID=272562 RepID=Q97M15_CLOAB|nr:MULTISPECIES: GH1 family beta-glucosidase [Clostridium]AAK78365.1 Beta-glucosidase [Clostridium acetobutylicum ATCC 824]ADZ19434.1 Beta-glucosidase [Clostridium acetobutylicum EA 2018]AEI33204.1 Beta-glucosidase [Clostridium acetobutylicum DSM 1731]AWV80089.1 beta-glucosidase [Clostridium acetobutylicum]MBC2395911.1 beta-glucosidase [Clostridium acetobutylicum]
MKFPKDFFLGAASASYQVEGAWNEDGKGVSNWDVFTKIPGKTFEGTNGDVAVDHYHRYKEDVKLMAEMGLDSYRFSVSWPRIIPDGDGEINQKGIEFYNNLIDECLKYGIVPFVTLYHWDMPEVLEKAGGWTNKKTVDAFVKYAKACFEAFGDRVKRWITFNETIVFCSNGYLSGAHPPGITGDVKKYFQATHNVFTAHARSVIEYKKLKQYGEIGITHVFSPAFSVDDKEENKAAAYHANQYEITWYYDPILKGKYPEYVIKNIEKQGFLPDWTDEELNTLREAAPLNDFIGLNYYQPQRVIKNHDTGEKIERTRENSTGAPGNASFDGFYRTVKMDDKTYTKWGWEISPESLILGLEKLKEQYGDIKIYITENGLGDQDPIIEDEILDMPRIKFIEAHLRAIKEAISRGINLKGYYAWSVIDLLSWLNGYKKQYGFIYVDHKHNLDRKKKLSFYWYKKVIEERGKNI